MTTPRLIATDLDGTLVRSDLTISERSVAALARAVAAGIEVAVVTGRPVRWLTQVFRYVPRRGLVIAANGAVVYDPAADEVVDARPLPAGLVAELIDRLRGTRPDVRFAVELDGGRRMLHEPGYRHRPALPDTGSAEAPLVELLASTPVKLLARCHGGDPDEFALVVREAVAGLVEVTHSSYSGLAEISAPGVTKASGLAWLADRLGVRAADVVAFGDMPNDVPMLDWAGCGVAVGNAHPLVRAAADVVTASNDEDGVAVYVEQLLAGRAPDAA